jgi:hypothetical protein
MQTECSADLFHFVPVEGRKAVAAFDGGRMTTEAGAMLLGASDGQIRLIERLATHGAEAGGSAGVWSCLGWTVLGPAEGRTRGRL